MKKLLFSVFVLSVQPVLAGIIGNVRVIGKVAAYNQKTVSLIQLGYSKPTIVPRSSIVLPKGVKLKTGKVVTAVFSAEEIMEKLRQQKEQQQASNQTQQKK